MVYLIQISVMDIKNIDCLQFVPPIGEELQHVATDNGTCYHSDIYLLTRLSELKVSASMLEVIKSRFGEIQDSFPSDLRDEFDKLSDFDKMSQVDSRYQQFLSDKMDVAKHFMQQFDKVKNDIAEKVDADKYKKAKDALRDFTLRFGGYSSETSGV